MMRLTTRTHSTISPTLRRGFFIALFLVILPFSNLYPANSTSNSSTVLQGLTQDTDGNNVPYVSIVFQNSQTFILSDENGQFSCALPFQWEDSVMVQRIGFQPRMISTEELLNTGKIKLISTTLVMDAIEIQAEANFRGLATTLSSHTNTPGSGAQNHGKMLSHIPGIHIKSYGGPAGISTLSLDGGPSSHTRVVVNGIDITSAQNGETDISQLPLPFIESMKYIPFDITNSGSGGIDGTIKLESGNQQNHLNLSTGSFGHSAFDIYLKKQIASYWTSIQLGSRHESGNYPIIWDGEETLRRNNHFDQEFAALTIRKLIRPNLYWLFSTMGSSQDRGVSGLLWSHDTVSHRSDRLQITGSMLGWIRDKGSTHFKVSMRNSTDAYTNPNFRIDSDHSLQSYNLYLNDERALQSWLKMSSDISWHYDEITSSDVGQHERTSVSVALTPAFQLPLGVKFIPSYKNHSSPNLYRKTLKGLQLQIDINFGPVTHVAASQGEIYRYPSFNDLYWIPGGNPLLNPEETDVTTFQAGFDFGFLGDFQLQKQLKKSTNLIQWIPFISYWQPVNVQTATRESTKLIWQFVLPDRHFSVFAHNSWIKTMDHAISQKLRYSPDRTSAVGFTWSPPSYEFNLQYDYVSDRISMYGYPENVILGETELWSMSVAHFWQTRLGTFTLVLSGENLGDISYETIKGYPEPGRSYRISTKFSQ